jgi:hypothetical protein
VVEKHLATSWELSGKEQEDSITYVMNKAYEETQNSGTKGESIKADQARYGKLKASKNTQSTDQESEKSDPNRWTLPSVVERFD